ncbi:hypothetical protein AJ88_27670 [Mesorhizobium amorphae CCBAU 01583]|nr:hypothetical protein AJ88_27670 [Mesorhizobium amorphae CCBAU 01583]
MSLTLPIVGAGVGILKQAADFETAMNTFVANTGAAGDAFDQAKAKAIELGNASVFTATESANAMTELAKIGLDYSQIMGGAAQATLDLAAANGGQLVPAAGIAGDLVKQFNLEVKQLPGIVDNVTGTLIKSKLGFDDYRLAIGQTGGVASALGVSLEDMNTALAGTSNLFFSGSDAGTSFKTFLQRLTPNTKKAAELFAKLNLQFFDSQGKMKDLASIAEELQDKLGKLSEEDLNSIGGQIFGTDALRTAIGLMKLGSKGFKELAASINGVGANKLAEVRVQGLTGELNKFNSAVETLSIAIGDPACSSSRPAWWSSLLTHHGTVETQPGDAETRYCHRRCCRRDRTSADRTRSVRPWHRLCHWRHRQPDFGRAAAAQRFPVLHAIGPGDPAPRGCLRRFEARAWPSEKQAV